jgi:hypothetical protein
MRGNTGSELKDAPYPAGLSSYFSRSQAKMGDLSEGIPVRGVRPQNLPLQKQPT